MNGEKNAQWKMFNRFAAKSNGKSGLYCCDTNTLHVLLYIYLLFINLNVK